MAYRRRPRGVGVVQDPTTGKISMPWWCGPTVGILWSDQCAVATAAQLRLEQDMSNLGPAALANPTLVASLKEQWAQSYAEECAADPTSCAAAEAPITSAAEAGVQPFVDVATSAGKVLTTTTSFLSNPWILGIGAALVVLFAMSAMGGGSPRRYGR
jgi:hypothetical protein